MQTRVIGADHLEIAFEHGVICYVEANQRGVETDVGLGNVVSKEERLVIGLREVLF